MFQLTKEETNEISRSQIVTLKQGQNIKYLPYAFKEQGVSMLSGVIDTPKAVAMHIAIMRAFVEMRKFALTNKLLAQKLQQLEDKIGSHDVQLNQIYEAIENLLEDKVKKQNLPQKRRRIGFRPND